MTPKTILLTVGGAGVLGGTIAPIYYFATSGPRNIKELLIKEKQKPLNTENNDDEPTWAKLIKKYATNNGSHLNLRIKNLSFSSGADKTPTKQDIDKLKNECKNLFNSPITKDEKFETNKNHAMAWCTRNSNFARG